MPHEKLDIGMLENGKPFLLSAELQSLTAAALGLRGSGKTTTAGRIVEQLLKRGAPIVVIDPEDVWWGLKSSKDGRSAGFPVIVMGGEHGDTPIAASDGRVVADFVVDQRVPVIVSLRHMRKAGQQQFVTDFAEQIYHRKGETKNRVPLLIVIDEAHSFVPQKVDSGTARMVGAVEDLVRRGRSSGIGVMVISQRAASVNKDVLTQLELLIAHRQVSPQDRKALEEWIEAHDPSGRGPEFMTSLAALPRGVAWFWSPGWNLFEKVAVNDRTTFDSSATPKAGAQPKAPRKLAEVDLAALKEKLAQTIEVAKQNDPKELRRQIAELNAEVKKARSAPPAEDQSKRIMQQAESRAHDLAKQTERIWTTRMAEIARHVNRGHASLTEATKAVASAIELVYRIPEVPALPSAAQVGNARAALKPLPPIPPTAKTTPRPKPTSAGKTAKSGRDRMLLAIVQNPEGISSKAVGILSGLKPGTGTWSTYMSGLRSEGLIEGTSESLKPTAAGIEAAGDFEPLPKGDDLIAYWQERLGNSSGDRRMFDRLLDAYPGALTSTQLAELTGLKAGTGTWSTYLSNLRTLNLVEGSGIELRASKHLFEG